MPDVSACLSREDLQRLLLGQFSGPEAERLVEHLEQCSQCIDAAKTLPKQDTLVEALRGGTTAVEEPPDGPVHRLMERLKGLQAPFTESAVVVGTQDGSPALEPAAEVYAFLAPSQQPGEIGRLGPYRVLKVLGVGGMGVVFQAEDPHLQRLVALKTMLPGLAANPAAKERFRREARAAAAVSHEHVAHIYQVGEERGVAFLAMEFLKGETLEDRLQRQGVLPITEALRIGREVAAGLAAAHKLGLTHRDVKPSNIWLEAESGRVKILDFGLARAVDDDAPLTRTGTIVGTAWYMAPEQAAGTGVDPRCDLFSLGCVLYRLTTGELPFKGANAMQVLRSLEMTHPAPPRALNPETPLALSDLVMRLLAKDPAGRPPSAQAVVEALAAIEKSRTSSPAAPPRGPSRKRWWIVGGAAAAALAALAVAVAVIHLSTDHGELVVETDDPDVEATINKAGVTIHDPATGRKYTLKVGRQDVKSGDYEIDVAESPAGLEFSTKNFTLKSGDAVRVKAWIEKAEAKRPLDMGKPASQGVDDEWVKHVAALPPEKQVEEVAAKLKERNLGFNGAVGHSKIENGVVTEFTLWTDEVTDVSPVRALAGLKLLSCDGSDSGKGKLADLSSLKAMRLTELDCRYTQVSDLSPLKGMELTWLACDDTKVADLSPLKGMGLTYLSCASTQVSDLFPLKGMKLTYLACGATKVSDLSPLKGMGLTQLICENTKIADLSPLKDIKLTLLKCRDTKVTDLSPLKGMPLTVLWCGENKIADLSPLKGMPLKDLWCGSTEVADLSPLEGLPLTSLGCEKTKVTDLSPLKGMKLTSLQCADTKVADLSPLKGMPLKELWCDFKPDHDAEILRSLKTLEKINDKPAEEFWKEFDAKPPEKKP